MPTVTKRPTSQLVNFSNKYYLIDCGEGTQIQLKKAKVSFLKINNIFISHLHGDHYFGLVGLVSSMHLLGRVTDLHIYCPKDLKEIIDVPDFISWADRERDLSAWLGNNIQNSAAHELYQMESKIKVSIIHLMKYYETLVKLNQHLIQF